MSNSDATILFHVEDQIANIRFNRPSALNALDRTMAEGLLTICKSIKASQDIGVVVISGEGRAFMAGGDLDYFKADLAAAAQAAPTVIDPLHEALSILTNLPQLVIASVHGAVAGAGVSLALACDLSIAAEGTRFNLAYSKIGASPDGSASWSLPRMVGLHKALELTLLAETFDAAEAQRLGMISRVVPAAALAAETEALAQRLASGPAFAFAKTKQLMRASFARTMEDQMLAERESFIACAKSADFVEGVSAFFDKRPPRFTGN
ncbi:enoyl-CoA hydratase-related protein [Glaciimonas sp. CA11.2]|uniref:enoyl-CoA hydratase/isomerase family protein n=1 Tax=unclassified Glaciimonas TaxID=2644401 RepID=UPI002AB39C5C|nr:MULTISPECIES: enoyl-CoA hydratase-related protein [unclassified Glaciimonas]MDY7546888.1 enoyl-CoA hydratase-related protein [Glaciimonas sp. CA11.2]MEB0012357.1 enoyl-CoA hydratase-related protein [Glaciimonas sp. Cout2]MEB0080457.1 enoyl-CoA hydratase-related protein [Glaciimonas sp. Gout2]MEB0161930.1 enoyl-CoA hydratase-related protein [Glaciimonas sp. CA11.2]